MKVTLTEEQMRRVIEIIRPNAIRIIQQEKLKQKEISQSGKP